MKERTAVKFQQPPQSEEKPKRRAFVCRLNRGDSRWFFNVSLPHVYLDGFFERHGLDTARAAIEPELASALLAELVEEAVLAINDNLEGRA